MNSNKNIGYTAEQSAKWERRIGCVKYTLFCFNIIAWMFGAGLFATSVWIRSDSDFEQWVIILNIQTYYVGIYILIFISLFIMAISFLGCVSALMENIMTLFVFIGTQLFGFILLAVGAALLLAYSTSNSEIQPIMRDVLRNLVMRSEQPGASQTLKMIQETIGCCGADGATDYIALRQPLPMECRDTVTGNAFFHGCVDELTFLMEDKSGWIAGLSMSLALINIVSGVMSLILIQAIQKEEEEARTYRR